MLGNIGKIIEQLRKRANELGLSDRIEWLGAATLFGAMRAGCAAAFVARPGMVLNPLAKRPDVVGSDLREVADQILEIEAAS